MVAAEADTCIWREIFNKTGYKANSLTNYNTVSTGVMTVVLGFWVSSSILMTKLKSDSSYRNLSNYTLATFVHRSMHCLIHVLPFFNMIYLWDDSKYNSCEFFGFLETFLAVFEMESLTHICIERYVQAKYMAKGWEMNPSFNLLYGSLSIFFAFLYSYTPMVGVGRYDKDFDCIHCTYDMVLPSDWRRYLVATVFFMKNIKPVIFMVLMLYWAKKLEMVRVKSQKQIRLTKAVSVMVLIVMALSIPITLVRGSVIISQLVYGTIIISFPINFIKWAMVLHWFSPTLGIIGLVCYDIRLRAYMIRYFTREDIVFMEERLREMEPIEEIKRE